MFTKIRARLRQRNVTKQGMQQAVNQTMRGIKTRMNVEQADINYYRHKLAYLKKLKGLIKDEGTKMKKLMRDLKIERERLNLMAKNLGKVGYTAGQLPPDMVKMANTQYKKIMDERTKERRMDQALLQNLEQQADTMGAMLSNVKNEIAEMKREQGLTVRGP